MKIKWSFIIWVMGLSSFIVNAQPYETHQTLPQGIKLNQVEYQGHQINYAFSGNHEAPGVLFIHGTPGSWQAFGEYLNDKQLQKQFFMISVDRLGWGSSEFKKSSSQKVSEAYRFSVQAESIKAILSAHPKKKWLIVGHSLGASIAPKIAMESPKQVKGMLLLAGSLKPTLGKARWYNIAGSLWAIRWMLPRELKYANNEIMVLKKELKQMEVELLSRQLETKVVLIQGMKDKLVSPKNAQYVNEQWSQVFTNLEVIELEEAGHFLPWENSALIKQTLLAFKF